MANPNSLSREVLKWVQSLDLAYSVKNARRDFSNGFLLAEIFSRYYDKDIQMHSFDNGNALAVKLDNWEQLMKFFRKRNILLAGEPVSQDEVHNIIHAKSGAVVQFLNKAFEFLSGRKVQKVKAMPAEPYVPAFAKPTATQRVHDALREPDMQMTADISALQERSRQTLDDHQDSLAEQKSQDPTRFAPTQKRNKVVRGQTRTVGAAAEARTVTVKKVAVKALDKNVAHLRATKEMHAAASSQSRISGVQPVASGVLGQGSFEHGQGSTGNGMSIGAGMAPSAMPAHAAPPSRSAVDIISGCVLRSLDGHPVQRTFAPNQPAAFSFLDALRDPTAQISDEQVTAVLDDLTEAVDSASEPGLADVCIHNPREFYETVAFVAPLLTTFSAGSSAFGSAANLLQSLGETMNDRNCHTTNALFQDFALSSIVAMLRRSSDKRQPLLEVMYAFTGKEIAMRIQAVRALQQRLDDFTVFLHCLTTLIFCETKFDQSLLDLYVYYCMIGLSMPSPHIRASSVSMLSVVAEHSPAALVGIMNSLYALRGDKWWEVQAQLLIVASALLQRYGSDGLPFSGRGQDVSTEATAAAVAAAIDLVLEVYRPDANPSVLRVGTAHLTKAVNMHPELAMRFVDCLAALAPAARSALLDASGPADELPVPSSAGTRFELPACSGVWVGHVILHGLAELVEHFELSNLEQEHFQILEAVFRSEHDRKGKIDDNMLEGFERIKSHVFVGLCDPDCVQDAAGVLHLLMTDERTGHRYLTDPALAFAVLLMIDPSQPGSGCVEALDGTAALLRAVLVTGTPTLREGLVAMFSAVREKNPAALDGAAPLRAVEQEL